MKALLTLLISLLVPFFSWAHYKLSICAIFQDEAPYMKEWIDYHSQKGVEHFWLYNNNSSDNYKDILLPYMDEGIVELFDLPSIQGDNDFENFVSVVQPTAYNDALTRSRGKTKWLAIIDLDEFIVPVNSESIPRIINTHFNQCSGVCINWQCYGTSHVYRCESILKELTIKMRWNHDHNKYYKSIVRPDHVLYNNNPHLCVYKQGCYHVNCNLERFDVVNPGIYIDKLRINHYWTKDEWFLNEIKVPRYRKWGVDVQHVLEFAEEMNFEEDRILAD